MPLDYDLEFEQDIEPKKVLQLLVDSHRFQWQDVGISGFGIWINAYKEDEEDIKILTEKRIKFQPQTVVRFSYRSKSDSENEERTLIRAVMTLLNNVSGNAVLLFNCETIVFQRIENQLTFNNNFFEKYTADEMQKLNIPYKLEKLPKVT